MNAHVSTHTLVCIGLYASKLYMVVPTMYHHHPREYSMRLPLSVNFVQRKSIEIVPNDFAAAEGTATYQQKRS